MSNKTHILNIRLDDSEYAALCRLKARSGAPFTSIIRSLIVDTDSSQRPLGVSAASPPAQNVSNAPMPPAETAPRLSALEEKLQYQLKLMQAREDLRLKRELERDARRELEREEREATRLARVAEKAEQKEADRQAMQSRKVAAEKEKAILKAIRSGDHFAGMTPEGFAKYTAALEQSKREELEYAQEQARLTEERRKQAAIDNEQSELLAVWSDRYDAACARRYKGPHNQARLQRALTLTDQADIYVEMEELEACIDLAKFGQEGIDTLRQMAANFRAQPLPYKSFNLNIKYI